MGYFPPAAPLHSLGAAASGQYQLCSHVVAVAASALVAGQASFMPIDIGPVPKAFNQIAISVSGAQVAGTTVTTLGIYADDGTGSKPNLVGGPFASGTVVLTATGVVGVAITQTLRPGRYWLAFLYTQSVAPTTAPQLFCVASAIAGSSSSPGTTTRMLIATGQSALPTTQIALAGSGLTSGPSMALRLV